MFSLSGGHEATIPGGIVRAELGRARQEGRFTGQAAAAASTLGRALEFGRNLLIGPYGSRGAVPGPAIGIQPGIDRGRQSLVHPAAIGLRGTLIDRRAQETAPSGS